MGWYNFFYYSRHLLYFWKNSKNARKPFTKKKQIKKGVAPLFMTFF